MSSRNISGGEAIYPIIIWDTVTSPPASVRASSQIKRTFPVKRASACQEVLQLSGQWVSGYRHQPYKVTTQELIVSEMPSIVEEKPDPRSQRREYVGEILRCNRKDSPPS